MIAMQVLVFPRWSAVRGVAYLPMLDDAALAARWAHLALGVVSVLAPHRFA